MHGPLAYLSGAGLGAAIMYLFDPDQGRRRRAMLRDECASAVRQCEVDLERSWRDLRQRAEGAFCEMRGRLSPTPAPDGVLVERVRAKLGRYTSHPGAIFVEASHGRVELSGQILAREVERLVEAVRSVPGVQSVDNRLESKPSSEGISALQGGREPAGERWNIQEANWAPATQLVVGGASGLLLAFGLRQGSISACALGALGLGLCQSQRQKQQQAQRGPREYVRGQPQSEPAAPSVVL